MPSSELGRAERDALIDVAFRSIDRGIAGGGALEIAAVDYPECLREQRASFVTLRVEGSLRGCVGSIEARMSLVEDVAENAQRAAFGDPRFWPLSSAERDRLHIHLSVLTPLQPLVARSREELIEQLQPKRDGLVLRQGAFQATFLPAVWDTLEDPAEFVSALESKAGFPGDAWHREVLCHRYSAEEWSR